MPRFINRCLCLLLFIQLLPLACWAQSNTTYTAYNMWYEVPTRMWAINYKRGTILPAGTKVRNVSVYHKLNQPHQYIDFERVNDGKQFRVYFRRKFHPGKTVEDYQKLMFTSQTLEQQTRGFSDTEITAILRGVLVPGMAKKAALISYGIPPQHQTPSLKANIWRYWTSRMVSKNICFDRDDKTTHCKGNETL